MRRIALRLNLTSFVQAHKSSSRESISACSRLASLQRRRPSPLPYIFSFVFRCVLPLLAPQNSLHSMGRKQRTTRQQAPPPDQEEELDIDAFSDALRPSGLCIRDVNNDGNCFFRAVSDQLYGSEDYHMKLRERACDYLIRNKEHYKHFVDDEQSFDDYVADMRNDGVWADNLELQAISMALKVNIRVHQSGKPSYDIRNHTAKNAQAIHLSYHFAEHYASVRPLHTANLPVPAQHDPLPPPKAASSTIQDTDENNSDRQRRRPRRKSNTEIDSVGAMWKRADRGCCDLCALVDKTRRAAKNFRATEPVSAEEDVRYETARRIELDMKQARDELDEIAQRILDGRTVHRARKKRIGWDDMEGRALIPALPGIGEERVRYEGSENEEADYWKQVRVETEHIFDILTEMENAVRRALDVVILLSKEASSKGGSSRMLKGGKKKEQDAKRKERKERRRKEQERFARTETDDLYANELSRLQQLDIAI